MRKRLRADVKRVTPSRHSGTLPIDLFQADEVLSYIVRRCRCFIGAVIDGQHKSIG